MRATRERGAAYQLRLAREQELAAMAHELQQELLLVREATVDGLDAGPVLDHALVVVDLLGELLDRRLHLQ